MPTCPRAFPKRRPSTSGDVTIPGIADIDYGDYAVRAQINWKPAKSQLIYASFNRGIKGENWSLDTLGAVAAENLKHGPEKLRSE